MIQAASTSAPAPIGAVAVRASKSPCTVILVGQSAERNILGAPDVRSHSFGNRVQKLLLLVQGKSLARSIFHPCYLASLPT